MEGETVATDVLLLVQDETAGFQRTGGWQVSYSATHCIEDPFCKVTGGIGWLGSLALGLIRYPQTSFSLSVYRGPLVGDGAAAVCEP